MRCKHCGGEITLETAYCPYCGKPNEHALQHAEDMETYQRVYEDTKSDVQETAHKFTGVMVRAVIIAALLIVSVVLLVLGAKAFDFKRMWKEKQAERNSAQIMQELDACLENEEYIMINCIFQENYIYTYDTVFEKYTPIERACQYYQYLYEQMMQVALPPEYADRETDVERLVEQLDYFYTTTDIEEYEYCDGADTKENRENLKKMEKKVEVLLQTYCNLTEEEAKSFKTLSKAKKSILLEEAILNEN